MRDENREVRGKRRKEKGEGEGILAKLTKGMFSRSFATIRVHRCSFWSAFFKALSSLPLSAAFAVPSNDCFPALGMKHTSSGGRIPAPNRAPP